MGNTSSTSNQTQTHQHDNPPPAYTASTNSDTKDLKPINTDVDSKATHYAKEDYTPTSPSPKSGSSLKRFSGLFQTQRQKSISEDALELLRKYDILVLIDDSRSMAENGRRRWLEARDALAPLADKAGRYDTDGLDIYFLNSRSKGDGLTDAAGVLQLFESVRPNGATPLGDRLEEILQPYIEKLESAGTAENVRKIKPLDIVVITDGIPTDDPESVIVSIARRLDNGKFPLGQVGIQFVQVGNDSGAARYLKELDNALTKKYKIRDIVDTIPASKFKGGLNADALVKALLGGINRLIDNNP